VVSRVSARRDPTGEPGAIGAAFSDHSVGLAHRWRAPYGYIAGSGGGGGRVHLGGTQVRRLVLIGSIDACGVDWLWCVGLLGTRSAG